MTDEAGDRRRFVRQDGVAAAVAAVGLVLCLRARANWVPCAFVPFAVPGLLVVASRAYRRRVGDSARGLWASLGGYAVGGKTPWRAALAFVVVPVLVIYLSNDHFDLCLDSCPVVPTAISLVTEGNSNLDEFYRDVSWWRKTGAGQDGLPYFLRRSGGHLYSAYPAGMVPLAIPVVGLARLSGANLADPNVQTRLEKLAATVVAAVALGVFFLLALHLVSPAPALATTAILAFASGLATTVSQNLWQHDGVILGSLVVLLIEFRSPGRLGTMAQGLVCGTLPACRVTSVAFLVPFGLWVLTRSPRRAVVIVSVALLSAVPWATYYLAIYGNPIGPSFSQLNGPLWSADLTVPLAGLFLSPGRGLLIYQPWMILTPLILLPGVRGGRAVAPAGWEWVCVASLALLVGIVSAWNGWHGGYCWGSRLVIEMVPLCALLCAQPIARLGASGTGRAVVLSLALTGVLVHVPSLYLGAFRWNVVYAETRKEAVWSWSHAPFFAPFSLPPR